MAKSEGAQKNSANRWILKGIWERPLVIRKASKEEAAGMKAWAGRSLTGFGLWGLKTTQKFGCAMEENRVCMKQFGAEEGEDST